jgi:uncharacterized membrane protein
MGLFEGVILGIFSLNSVDRLLRVTLATIFILPVVLSVMAPLVQTFLGYPHGESTYRLLSPICHQYPTRSLWITGRPLALCTRCFSGYLGVSIASLLVFSSKRFFVRVTYGLLLLMPAVLDGMLQLNTSYESVNAVRVLTGFAGGMGVFLATYPLRSRSSLNHLMKGVKT